MTEAKATLGHRWVLTSHPKGEATKSNVKFEEWKLPDVFAANEVLVKVLYFSLDPYEKLLMMDDDIFTKDRAAPIGSVLKGRGVGKVMRCGEAVKGLEVGDLVTGEIGWRDWAVVASPQELTKVPLGTSPTHYLGPLGMPGATAFFGLFEICRPKPGDFLFVSGAAGAVGSMVGQMAKLSGCTVIGSARNADKCRFLTQELGFHHAIEYQGKSVDTLVQEIKQLAPNGINCYFDCTGGPVTEAVISHLAEYARIAICGQIAHYNKATERGPCIPMFTRMMFRRATAQGFIVHQFDKPERAHCRIDQWLKEGKLKIHEDVVEGLDKAYDSLLDLFKGRSLGKKIVKVAKD